MATRGARVEIGAIEQAVSDIVAWSTRNDVFDESMRRAKCDLSKRHVWLLGRLASCAPTRLSDLALVLDVERSTLSPQIQRLERDGFVEREADPADKRAAQLRVTKAGRALLARMHRTRRAMLAELLSSWPADEREQVAAYLARFATALG